LLQKEEALVKSEKQKKKYKEEFSVLEEKMNALKAENVKKNICNYHKKFKKRMNLEAKGIWAVEKKRGNYWTNSMIT